MADPKKKAEEKVTPLEDALRDPVEEESAQEEVEEVPDDTESTESAETEEKPDELSVLKEEFARKEAGLLEGTKAEREKRQRLEAEVDLLREQMQALTRTAPKQDETVPDFYKDPEAYVRSQFDTFRKESQQQALRMYEQMGRMRHQDFDEVIQNEFADAVRANPALGQHMLSAPDPAEFAYQEALKHRALKNYKGDFTAYESNLQGEAAKKIAELESQIKALQTRGVPESLSEEQSAGEASKPRKGQFEPTPLEGILPKRG